MSPKIKGKKVEARITPLDQFGSIIKTVRNKKRIEDLAEKAKMSTDLWERIEAGKATSEETLSNIRSIAFALRVNPKTLWRVLFKFVLDQ